MVSRGKNKENKALVIGAGLVGAHYTKRLLSQGISTVATVRDLESELALFERRVFGDQQTESEEISFGSTTARRYVREGADVILTSFDMLSDDIGSLLSASGSLSHVVNAVNLGTLFGLKTLKGEHPDLFAFSHQYHSALLNYAQESLSSENFLHHVLVSTTGSGGIGLERMRISHNREEHGIPASIIQKSACSAMLRTYFKDFQRSSVGQVTHHAIVPASAIVDLEVYSGPVEVYGDYRVLQEGRYMKRFSPRIMINGVEKQSLYELGLFHASYGLFGEDGPHTAFDLQQLELFMGVTTATKIAEIIDNTLRRSGAYQYDVLNGGSDIPEMSEYAVFGFEQKARKSRAESGNYSPVTLSPIAPFGIPLRSIAYEALANVGLETLKQLSQSPVDAASLEALAGKIVSRFAKESEELIAATSLGVRYALQTKEGSFEAVGPFERGVLTNETLRSCIEYAAEFERYRRNSSKLGEFLAVYDSRNGIQTQDIIGYLAAFPVATHMKKEGHF